jgi:putative oxidoreductase
VDAPAVDVAWLLLRLALAALLFGHAAQKLFGWFRGGGLRGTATAFEAWGLHPGAAFVLVAGLGELAGAASLGLGLLVPLGTAAVVASMAVAVAFNAAKGLWAHLGGYEVALVYGILAVALCLAGGGRYTADAALGLGGPAGLGGFGWAVAALALGLVGAVGPIALHARHVHRSRHSAVGEAAGRR